MTPLRLIPAPRSAPFLQLFLVASCLLAPVILGPGASVASGQEGKKPGQRERDAKDDAPRPDFRAILQAQVIEPSEMRAKGVRGATQVELGKTTRWIEHRVVSFEKVPSGATVTILARKYDKVEDPDTGIETPPTYSNIQTCVVGEDFVAPELTKEQRETKLVWVRGELTRDGVKQARIGGVLTRIGLDRKVLMFVPTKFEDLTSGRRPLLRKGAAILVTGFERPLEEEPEKLVRRHRKPEVRVEAVRIDVIAAQWRADEYRLILSDL